MVTEVQNLGNIWAIKTEGSKMRKFNYSYLVDAKDIKTVVFLHKAHRMTS